MPETVIVAAISLLGTLAGAYLANRKSSALIAYRLEQLEQKVNEHNNVIERTYKLEKEVGLQNAELKRVNRRIEDLEKRGA